MFAHTQRRWHGIAPEAMGLPADPKPTLNTGLAGPIQLRFEYIRAAIGKVTPGTYALGYGAAGGGFCVSQVGRSDSDIASRLIDQIGTHPLFKYIVFSNPSLAFEKECELWHGFSPPNNHRHPERTPGTTWTCPRCRQFGS